MAESPSHKFGQIVGDLLEEIVIPLLQTFCDDRGLYLDKKGVRGPARRGSKVQWQDKYDNTHDLDFVIERKGTVTEKGRPLAFIEAAWRRYTKHSRNKVQEIQGAILPIAEKYNWDKPFLGAVLAGVFTGGSLSQMKSSGFDVALFPYETIVEAFRSVGINAAFDEETGDRVFRKTISDIEAMTTTRWNSLKDRLIELNRDRFNAFAEELAKTLDRQIEEIFLIPLHGRATVFLKIEDVLTFVTNYQEDRPDAGEFQRYEVIVRYSNNDRVEANFKSKDKVVTFLTYIEKGVGR